MKVVKIIEALQQILPILVQFIIYLLHYTTLKLRLKIKKKRTPHWFIRFFTTKIIVLTKMIWYKPELNSKRILNFQTINLLPDLS